MLTIRDRQWARLNQIMNERLHRRLADLLAVVLPRLGGGEAADASAINGWIDDGRERAALLALNQDDDVAVVVVLSAAAQALPPEEAERLRDLIGDTLQHPTMSGKVKLAFIERQMRGAPDADGVCARMLEAFDTARQHFGTELA